MFESSSPECFECACGHKQTKYWEMLDIGCEVSCGGITEKTAILIGWKNVGGVWKCPFCNGKSSNLKRLFGTCFSIKREGLMEVNENLGVIEAISEALDVEIKNSRYILDLKENWDDEGAPAYKESVLNRAISFLKTHANAFYKIFSEPILAPKIWHGPHGSIDLCWMARASKIALAITIPEAITDAVEYYGDRSETDKVEGALNETDLSLWLFFWLMKDSDCVSKKKESAEYRHLTYDLWVHQNGSKISWVPVTERTISDFWPVYPSLLVETADCGDIEFRIHQVQNDLFYSIWVDRKNGGKGEFADGYFRKSIGMTKSQTLKFYRKLMRERLTGEISD